MATRMQSVASTSGRVAQPRAPFTRSFGRVYVPRFVVYATPEGKDTVTAIKDAAADKVDKLSDKANQVKSEVKQTTTVQTDKTQAAFSSDLRPQYANAVEVNPLVPAFTRRREIFAGRLAMLGFLSACIGEVVTGGDGIISQVQMYTGLKPDTVAAIFVGLIAYNAIAALGPNTPTFSDENQKDVAKRPAGPPQGVTLINAPKALGIADNTWGFTKQSELFNGRTAQLGFLAALLGEYATGKGPLGQVANYLGVQADGRFYALAASAFITFTGASLLLSSATGRLGQKQAGDNSIY